MSSRQESITHPDGSFFTPTRRHGFSGAGKPIMSSDQQEPQHSRSPESLRFEAIIRESTAPGLLPKLDDIKVDRLMDLSGWIAVVRPSVQTRTLVFAHAGAALSLMQGGPLVGLDYLELVDPAYKGEAFDSTFLMLTRPCGLWQVTPARFTDGSTSHIEYTGFPAYDERNQSGVIAFLVKLPRPPAGSIALVGHATAWEWLEFRSPLAG